MTANGRLIYPAPRFPEIPPLVDSVDALLPAARVAVERRGAGRSLLGLAGPGEQVLLVTPGEGGQDPLVVEAVIKAYAERGIKAGSVSYDEIGIQTVDETLTGDDGWKELFWRDSMAALLPPELQDQRPRNIVQHDKLRPYLEQHPEFNAVFVGGEAFPTWRRAAGDAGSRLRDLWWYTSQDKLASEWNTFPSDVLDLAERKTLAAIPNACEVRITDPEGTDVWFELTPDQAQLWSEAAWITGHLGMFPSGQVSERAAVQRNMLDEQPFMHIKAQGVIAGSSDHVGFYPHMRGYLEDGVVTGIEGGGLLGDLLDGILMKTKNTKYPFHDKAGYYYLCEVALGTSPKYYPELSLFERGCPWFGNVWERNRSGVLHWGIGVESRHPAVVEFAKEHGLPDRHSWHFHTRFSTYSIKQRDTGEWITVVDKGRITAFDDPEVRALASRYGEPDQLLQECWVPAVPGINYPGDFARDYAPDPASWSRRDIVDRLPATVGVPG